MCRSASRRELPVSQSASQQCACGAGVRGERVAAVDGPRAVRAGAAGGRAAGAARRRRLAGRAARARLAAAARAAGRLPARVHARAPGTARLAAGVLQSSVSYGTRFPSRELYA